MQTGNTETVGGFAGILAELSRPLEPQLVKQREGFKDRNGNTKMIDYVEWFVVADILDQAAPEWSHTIKSIQEVGDQLAVVVALTIDGVTREGLGTGNAHNDTGLKKAEHDALKRAAVKFGVARDLYRKEEGFGGYNDDGPATFPNQPIARNLGELITAKQLGMIRALARELRIDADEECNSVMRCRTDELSKSAGSSFIKHLQELQRPTEPSRQAPDNSGSYYTPPAPEQRSPNLPAEAYDRPPARQANGGGSGGYGPATKPDRGAFGISSDAASVKQLGVLSKIAVEHGVTVEDLIQQEFDDVSSSSDLSKKAASYLIETHKTW